MTHAQADTQTKPPDRYIKIPDDLHQAVKIQASIQRREMREIAAEAISDWLKQHSVSVESSVPANGK